MAAPIVYLGFSDVLEIHSFLIDETGGRHGLRDRGGLISIVESPKQEVFSRVLYPTIFDKAAVYVRGVIRNHPFIDGNKRTGMTSAFVFLEDNGYYANVNRGDIEKFALRVVIKKLDIPAIAVWLKEYSRKI